jgi:hypothetical protein
MWIFRTDKCLHIGRWTDRNWIRVLFYLMHRYRNDQGSYMVEARFQLFLVSYMNWFYQPANSAFPFIQFLKKPWRLRLRTQCSRAPVISVFVRFFLHEFQHNSYNLPILVFQRFSIKSSLNGNIQVLYITSYSTTKCTFEEDLCKMVPTLILICLSMLLQTPSHTWSTTLVPEHEVALLMQCVESIRDVLFLDHFIVCDAMCNFFLGNTNFII